MQQNLVSKKFRVTILTIGICLISIDSWAAKLVESLPDRRPASDAADRPLEVYESDGFIDVEPLNISAKKSDGKYQLVPYSERRSSGGKTFSIGVGQFYPLNFNSNATEQLIDDVYPDDEQMVEIMIEWKKNYSFFSLGLEMGAGYQSLSYLDSANEESTLNITPIRLGLRVALETLMKEPLVVPYAAVGVYTINYTEEWEAVTVDGGTEVSYYVTAGAKFQLNWLEREAARIAYEESGVENTFIYVEAKMFGASQNESDPDFSTDASIAAGLNLEF